MTVAAGEAHQRSSRKVGLVVPTRTGRGVGLVTADAMASCLGHRSGVVIGTSPRRHTYGITAGTRLEGQAQGLARRVALGPAPRGDVT